MNRFKRTPQSSLVFYQGHARSRFSRGSLQESDPQTGLVRVDFNRTS